LGKDSFEWHQEAVQDRDAAHSLLQAKQHEFDVNWLSVVKSSHYSDNNSRSTLIVIFA
jgi:hypothetical protein